AGRRDPDGHARGSGPRRGGRHGRGRGRGDRHPAQSSALTPHPAGLSAVLRVRGATIGAMDPNKLNHGPSAETPKLIKTRSRSGDRPRPQVRPQAEGWTQITNPDGRPTLQFASPRVKQPETHLADMTLAE